MRGAHLFGLEKKHVLLVVGACLAAGATICAFGPVSCELLRVQRALSVARSTREGHVSLSDREWRLFVRRITSAHSDAFERFKAAKARGNLAWKERWKAEERVIREWNILLDVWEQRGDDDAAEYLFGHVDSGEALPDELANFEQVRALVRSGSYAYAAYGRDRSECVLGGVSRNAPSFPQKLFEAGQGSD